MRRTRVGRRLAVSIPTGNQAGLARVRLMNSFTGEIHEGPADSMVQRFATMLCEAPSGPMTLKVEVLDG